ncbi:PREDICTED: proto-oncogene tyrosine-protein kinase ROS isoform X2 [Wasmannia auropunctata]|uniref:proto-oncogene tyrosine-protein kinase ROS isoform X2 n=1 Tax=Wasmannia auropunctata TaxID=64793 RepID=UPI0005F0B958|nr:PREDICTED: proto-oncogene tyrosine-protein kinase ROS isoform X2 [Wasmannia auropunctata]
MLGTGLCFLLKVLVVAGAAVALLPPRLEDLELDHVMPASLQEECASKCPDLDLTQNRTDDLSSEVGCGVRCKIDQCTKGCEAWEQALDTSCQAVCNGTQELLPPKELYCVLGCHDALNRYFQQLKAEIGIPPAPALVADSLTATSLSLEWKGVDIDRRAGITYLVQWRYEERAETWQYCRNQSWDRESDQILVENLQPYTKYRFRVALLLKSSQHNPEPIFSAPSVVILTYAAGLPTSAPIILRSVPVDSYRVSVSWEPGPFPNGPLLSYVLRLQGVEHSQLKDIPVSDNTDHYMFQNLQPNQNYSVSVTMRNGVGEGPPATVYISTTPEPTVKDTQEPILILGGKHLIRKQNANMLDEPSVIYRTENVICGVAVHVASAQLFVSTSNGYVFRTSIIERSTPRAILTPGAMSFTPMSLSVDWLNLHLYILKEMKYTTWQISRCNLDGKSCTVAVAGHVSTRPSHIEIDPYNGYLFWISKAGLYRLDLAAISNGVKHEVSPDLILEDSNLGAFTIDHMNFRLLVPHNKNNTVFSVSLDGREVFDLRPNTQTPKFINTVSLATANGLFYWTNGEEVLTEGYHPGQDRYFHNSYPDKSNTSFVSVTVLMNASQPIPVPVNPPTGVQAVLGVERAKISWQAPHLLGGQGKGAWQNWLYELEIKNEFTGEIRQIINHMNIAGLSDTVHNLRERSVYLIRAAAYTSAGRGPWSTEFRGRTLRNGSHASILWSSNEGILRSDVTGENIDTLVNKAILQESENEFHIVDVSWYKDVLYIVGNNSALYRYNISNHQKTKLNIHSVGSVAVDWISKKLYWANPKQQIITRANLNGSQQEPMSILAIVKELMIDSLEAYLYWSTGHAVEVARLNGQDRRSYHVDEIFTGRQVMGLTLDTENRYVYWIVRSYEHGSIVYRAPTSERIPMSHKIISEKVSALQHPSIQGPLCYFSEHLLWLQDDRNAVIGDLSGQNTAVINGITLSSLYMVAVIDPAHHKYPKNLTSETVVVLPNAVNHSSIRVEGTWRNFNISWDPVKNINYGTVFYEVKFADYINTNSNPEITIETTMPYNNSDQILPYSILEVTVKAFTYWETAHHSRKILRSPQSVPTEPTSPRAFVEFYKNILLQESQDIDIFAIFRWNQPEFTNGVIQGYTVHCWSIENRKEKSVFHDYSIPATELEFLLPNLRRNTTYYFKVRAHTEIGAGPFTDPIGVSSTYENPVPKLLVATADAVRISDLDNEINYTLTRHIASEVNYLTMENKIYWISEMRELVTSDMNGANATKILTLNNTAHSLCVDWVARNLYWVEYEYNKDEWQISSSYIMRLDLTMWSSHIVKYDIILRRGGRIPTLDMLPSLGSLYWNEGSAIMQSDLEGKNVQYFFRNNSSACTCPQRYLQSLISTLTIDKTNIKKPMMYWISSNGRLNVADIYGCECNVILQASFKTPALTYLTVDKMNIYWSNETEDQIYFLKKEHSFVADKENSSKPEVKSFYLPNVRQIKAFGKSLQPYPTAMCLRPRQINYNVERVSETADSILVSLPEPSPEHGCHRYSLPTTLYRINVSHCLKNEEPSKCEELTVKTYERRFEIKRLRPFTEYKLKLALTNLYVDMLSTPKFGADVVLKTSAGRPSRPENVTVEALTPTKAAVYWMPPQLLNSAMVSYEVHWVSPIYSQDGVRPKGEQLVTDLKRTADGRFFMILQPLSPGQKYVVSVRVYPADFYNLYNDSHGQDLYMYSEPNNLTMNGVSMNSMNISWTPSVNLTLDYLLEYQDVATEEWQVARHAEANGSEVVYHIKGLQPRTSYKFRLRLKYKEDFIWPSDERFTFQTLGDVPSAPGVPVVTRFRNALYQINWDPAQAHGSQVTLYRLEGLVVDDSYKPGDKSSENEHWNLYYNGTDNYWIIPGDVDQKYHFRVQAKNAYGFGAWSKSSAIVDLTENAGGILATQQHLPLMLGLIAIVITIVFVCFCYFFCLYRQRKEDKKTVLPPIVSNVELATLREIPRGNFVQSNALYASTLQNDPDDSALPKIRQEQITLTKFLGSGAFGKVFQGNAKDLEGPGITPVAIKMLRKDASSQEKTEFVQEARLMSHFRHKHVLRLLGVCLDTDPPLLVLELMEAGDLLSYLRESRSLQPTDSHALRLQDLLAMCEDVARGCRYLEELHFVHRDLACRNCLVSARDRENRVVKIGDFGLARDIYKNDYYRKEGEGLLPVRWMSPESLVDGVFTSQSDVWAFGVLMWEITSLGQQPYPARTNLEVLHYVRAGGRLPKPLNCPPTLHQLMLRCWSTADARPSFKICLESIVVLRGHIEDAVLSPAHAGHYLARRGVSNMAYFAEENQNHNNSGNSWKSSSSEGSRDMQPFLQNSNNATLGPQSGEAPKYLELLADNEDIVLRENPTNGYEVPRSIHISDQNLSNISTISCTNHDRKSSLPTEATDERKECSTEDRKLSNGKLYKRSSIASLNLPDQKGTSISGMPEKCNTLDSSKSVNSIAKATLNRGSFSSLNGQRKYKIGLNERRDSEASIEDKSCSTHSLAPSTRPSSSLITSQTVLPCLKSNVVVVSSAVNGEVLSSESAVTKSTLPKVQRTHSSLQNGKANIPLVINSALLNLLRQTPVVEDAPSSTPSGNIVTYTNINADAVRVNGS